MRLNNRGFLSADFLFAMIIGITISMMLFVFCFTFSSVEVAQYVAFAVGRAHMAGHEDPAKQELMAKNKFEHLLKRSALGALFRNDWFELKNLDIRGGVAGRDFSSDYRYDVVAGGRVPQTGVRLDFVAKILNFKIPFLGSSNDGETAFSARVTGLLFREPTSSECQEQMKANQRYRAVLDLDPGRYGRSDPSRGSNPNYVPLEDNGC